MIFDHLSHWKHLHTNEALEKAFSFLTKLKTDCDLGEYPLIGHAMFARVMEYDTKPAGEVICESHRRYVDIQSTLAGSEDIECFFTPHLEIDTPYVEDRDVEFYQKPENAPVRLTMTPGYFVILHPQDAHSPGITSPGSGGGKVKKVVIKIDNDLLHGRHPDFS